jgi:hypothetical protein
MINIKHLAHFIILVSLLAMGLTSCKKDDSDVLIISPVAGDYVGKETCAPTPPSDNYTVSIYNQSTGDKVFIHNVYGIGGTYEATVSGNTITVPSTPYTYQSGTTTYKGNISANGTLDGNILTIHYKLDGDLADECQFVGNREFRAPTVQGG